MLADDTRRLFALPTPIEEITVGEDADLDLGYLVRVLDTDGAANITLTFEDMHGERCEYTRPAGTKVNVYLPYRTVTVQPRRRCRTAHDAFVAGWEDTAGMPRPSDATLERLALLWRPYVHPETEPEAAA